MHECAYIGDDSSEELDELLEITGIGNLSSTENPSNHHKLFKQLSRHIEFLDARLKNMSDHNEMHSENIKSDELLNLKETQKILDLMKVKKPKHHSTNDNKHVHREANVGKNEMGNIKFLDKNLDERIKK